MKWAFICFLLTRHLILQLQVCFRDPIHKAWGQSLLQRAQGSQLDRSLLWQGSFVKPFVAAWKHQHFTQPPPSSLSPQSGNGEDFADGRSQIKKWANSPFDDKEGWNVACRAPTGIIPGPVRMSLCTALVLWELILDMKIGIDADLENKETSEKLKTYFCIDHDGVRRKQNGCKAIWCLTGIYLVQTG